MDILTSEEFMERLRALGGYHTEDTGKVKYEQE
jgi:hypothetical protein